VIVIQSTILYWFRCDECGYESPDYARESNAESSAERHECPVPPVALFEIEHIFDSM
jgi:hypothetical protein